MKHFYTSLVGTIALSSIIGLCHSQPISQIRATNIASRFFHETVREVPLSISPYSVNTSQTQAVRLDNEAKAYMYAVNMPDSGWVLVAGDERATPILGICDKGTFPSEENMPPGMADLLRDYEDEIRFIQDSCPNVLAHPNWKTMENGSYFQKWLSASNSTPRYIEGNSLLNRPHRGEVKWNQNRKSRAEYCDKTYNKFCPTWYDLDFCGRTVVGCTAVAMGQIMWYWQWPHTGLIPTSINKEGETSETKELRLYDWNLMPTELTNSTPMEEVDMVAGFLRDCGYAINTKYKSDGSYATLADAKKTLEETFAYTGISHKRKFWTINWEDKLREEIDANRPVLYAGQGSGGHAFVVDGYLGEHFHINWGYNGTGNGYFSLSNLSFYIYRGDDNYEYHEYNSKQEALFGIRPAPSCNAITVTNQNIGSGGVYRTGTNGTITVSNSTIGNGAMGVFYSGTSVILRPGFQTKAGSHVHVAIQHFPCDGVAPLSVRSAAMQGEPRDEAASDIEAADGGLRLYPNPTDGLLTVQSPKPLARIEVYGLGGERLLESRDTTLDLHALPDGMYIVMLHFADGTRHSEKVVKQL